MNDCFKFVAAFLGATSILVACDKEDNVIISGDETKQKNYKFSLQSQNVIYNNCKHAAFTSLYDYSGTLLLAFREGTAHRPASEAEYGCIKVLTQNGIDWSVSATISDATKDLRDPFT